MTRAMEDLSFLSPATAVRAAHIREGMQVADFGTGSGFFARAAARAVGPTGRVWAVDANRSLLTRLATLGAAEGLTNIEIIAGDCEAPEGSQLQSESMDFVILSNVLFSAEHKDALLGETWRVLRGGAKSGRALIIDWKDTGGGLGPHKSHVVSEDAARALCAKSGFSVLESVPAGSYHWGFVVQKNSR